ncbi:MAG: hypothetical protein AAF267_24585 [Deinococcota bacterium]
MAHDRTNDNQQLAQDGSDGSALSVAQDDIQQMVTALAEPLGLTVQFATGKRHSDMFTMQLRGDRRRAMAFYEHVNRALPHLAVELFNVGEDQFGMIAAVVKPATSSLSFHNERRKRNPHSYVAKRD